MTNKNFTNIFTATAMIFALPTSPAQAQDDGPKRITPKDRICVERTIQNISGLTSISEIEIAEPDNSLGTAREVAHMEADFNIHNFKGTLYIIQDAGKAETEVQVSFDAKFVNGEWISSEKFTQDDKRKMRDIEKRIQIEAEEKSIPCHDTEFRSANLNASAHNHIY